ncbi:MAG: pyridoxal phosphate-dependent aminotransferase [Candidatus Promineifilaceae bacterium]
MAQRPLLNPLILNSILNSRRLAAMGELKTPFPPEQLLNLSTNENAFGTAPSVVTAIQREAATLHLYPSRTGELQLREKLATMHGHGLTANNIVLGNAGSRILALAADGFLQPGDEVISFTPTFGFYPNAAQRLGATMVWLPLSAETNFQINVDDVLNAVTERTRAVYLCNPNNPTGSMINSAEFDRLVDALPPDILIVSDEVYYQFVDDDTFPNSTKHVQAGRNLIQVFSFSKAYGLAGLRLGYGIMRPEIGTYFAKMQSTFQIGRLPIAAGLAAVDAQDHIAHTANNIIHGRNWLRDQMQALGVTVYPSQGNFLLLEAPIAGAKLTHQLLKKHGIMVADGKQRFGLPACIRVTVGTPENNQRFITALASVLEGRKE